MLIASAVHMPIKPSLKTSIAYGVTKGACNMLSTRIPGREKSGRVLGARHEL